MSCKNQLEEDLRFMKEENSKVLIEKSVLVDENKKLIEENCRLRSEIDSNNLMKIEMNKNEIISVAELAEENSKINQDRIQLLDEELIKVRALLKAAEEKNVKNNKLINSLAEEKEYLNRMLEEKQKGETILTQKMEQNTRMKYENEWEIDHYEKQKIIEALNCISDRNETTKYKAFESAAYLNTTTLKEEAKMNKSEVIDILTNFEIDSRADQALSNIVTKRNRLDYLKMKKRDRELRSKSKENVYTASLFTSPLTSQSPTQSFCN